jgi:hypothetical protein
MLSKIASLNSWLDGVVPLAVKIGADDGQGRRFGIGDLKPLRISARVQSGLDFEAAFRGCRGDEFDDYPMRYQRLATPVFGDFTKHPVLLYFGIRCLSRRASPV